MNLKTYEGQATFSVLMALAGAACACAAVALFFVRGGFDAEHFMLPLERFGRRYLAIVGAVGLGTLCGFIGFFVGLNSAGQRRNQANARSWTGFFLSASVVALSLSIGAFFWLTKVEMG